MPSTNPIPPGAHELLTTISRALEADPEAGAGNHRMVAGVLRALLRGSAEAVQNQRIAVYSTAAAPLDSDCRILATVLANACEVSNDPEDGA